METEVALPERFPSALRQVTRPGPQGRMGGPHHEVATTKNEQIISTDVKTGVFWKHMLSVTSLSYTEVTIRKCNSKQGLPVNGSEQLMSWQREHEQRLYGIKTTCIVGRGFGSEAIFELCQRHTVALLLIRGNLPYMIPTTTLTRNYLRVLYVWMIR